jgi:CxxC-x17-CxxC domain-containing protein
MSFQDKSIQCSDCGATFIFGVAEQEFFQTKGFTNEPKRCSACRAAKKQSMSGSSSYGGGSGNSSYGSTSRQMFPVKCATCGKDTEVPFEPRGDKPVYCIDCYRKTNPVKKY